MPFTADFADILCGRCLHDNYGIRADGDVWIAIWNLPRYYRVVVRTKVCETEIEFDKVFGFCRYWTQGVEHNAELN